MAVPLLHDESALGVLEVLDRQSRFTLQEMELLGLFASQAAIALDLLQRARTPKRRSPATASSRRSRVSQRALDGLDEEARPGAQQLLDALATVLKRS